jgi:hypothetical protein
MCDYSLHHVASSPAQVGDKLVTTAFAMSGTRGFAAQGRADVVVCVPPGAEIAFEKEVEVDRALGLLPTRKLGATVARFRQINMDRPHAHHDALEFPDGTVILLTNLAVGQKATVLQLPAQPQTAAAERPAIETAPQAPADDSGVIGAAPAPRAPAPSEPMAVRNRA